MSVFPEPFDRSSREWRQSACIADQMAMTLTCMGRVRVPALEDLDTWGPVIPPYERQSRALWSVVRLLASEEEAEELYQYLLSGSSALLWKRN